MNGISGVTVMAAPPLISSTWFPFLIFLMKAFFICISKKAPIFLKLRRKIQISFLRFPTKERTTATAINQVLQITT